MKESVKTQLTEPEDGRSRRALYWVVAASVLIRLVFVIFFSGYTQNELLDSERYTRVALNVLAGNGYAEWGTHPTAFVPPLYPLFLAGCYGLFGIHPLLVQIFQAMLGGLLPWAVFGMGCRLAGDRTALLAAAAAAVYPELVVLTGYLYTETFFILLECLFFLFLLDAFRADRTKDWILSGIFLGLGMLVRSLLFFFPPFLFLACVAVKPLRTRLKRIVLMSLVGYSLLTPWTVRNALVFHRLVPMTTGGGGEFWVGSDVAHGGRYRHGETYAQIEAMTAGAKSEPEKDDILFRAAFRNIRENPLGYVRVCLGKVWRYFFQIYENVPTGSARTPNWIIFIVLGLSYYPLLIFGLVGLRMPRLEVQKWAPLAVLFAYTLLLFTATHFVPRYRIPLIPFLCLFAATGFFRIVTSLHNAIQRRG